ncbi:MAG TPA: AbrB/MazE/SpoVT family DNA-binding domain-containing protein [Dermatophilaceae bacterium]|nr:AbrB/MazE/SpoVT family DNA-binding domain-containing protein [Dermatophilaceae bacterium]
MEATIDSVGRVLLPKRLRDALGLAPGTKVDISPYGGGVQITPGGRTARLEREASGCLVARRTTVVTDDMMLALIDAGRR